MNILRKLTRLDLKLNKKRTIGTLLGIILATALITVVGGMFEVLRNTLVETTIESTGYYHVQLLNIDKSDLEKIKNNKDFSRVLTAGYVGSTYDENNEYMSSVVLSVSEETFNELNNKVIDGHFPKNDNEILIDRIIANVNEIKIGDTVKVATDLAFEENGSYDIKYDNLKEYKVVGTSSLYGTSLITNNDSDTYMAYLTLKNPKNHMKAISKLLGVDNYKTDQSTKYVSMVNKELLRWEVFSFSDSTAKFLLTVVGIVIFIILVTSVFSIRNSFAISTNEKIKLYGMLASTGATKKQIRHMVLFEGLCMGIMGIVGGIILGTFVVWLLTLIINMLAVNAHLVDSNMLYYKFSVIPMLVASVVSVVMIYFSTISSSIRAGRVSPIQNIRNSDKIKAKKLKVPFFIRNIFKTGGVLAYKNLKRSKKKYRVTVISLTVSIFIFIMVSSFLDYGLRSIKNEFGNINYDVSLYINDTQREEIDLKQLTSLAEAHVTYFKYIENSQSTYRLFDMSHVKDKNVITESCSKINENYECIERANSVVLVEQYYDDASFKEICKKIKVDYEEVKDKVILIDYVQNNKKYYRATNYKKGDILSLKNINDNNKVIDYEIGAISEYKPWGLEGYADSVIMVLNAKYYPDNLLLDSIYYKTDNANKLVDDLTNIDKSFDIENISEIAKQLNTIVIIFSIFIYGFIIVVTLIGVTSVFNTINSNMELRRREFATLKSIGMTKKEFNRMILLESIFYSSKSLFFGIILGIGGSYLVYQVFTKNLDFGYLFPLKSIIISIVFIVVLVYLIMEYSIKKTNKQNIIETIRKENI